jgi:hypothetical protein
VLGAKDQPAAAVVQWIWVLGCGRGHLLVAI